MAYLGVHEQTAAQSVQPIDCPNGNCSDPVDPGSGDGNCMILPNGHKHCFPQRYGSDPGNGNTPPTSGTTPPASGGQTCSSTSPEFCTLAGLLGSQMSVGAPITPYLQDNNTPTVVPTQTSSKSASLAIVLFIIAGALGYFYYRKHGGPSMHEAL